MFDFFESVEQNETAINHAIALFNSPNDRAIDDLISAQEPTKKPLLHSARARLFATFNKGS